MKKWIKGLTIFVVVLLIAGVLFMGYLLRARSQANEYLFQVDAVLSACEVANGGELLADPDRAVIAEYEGKKAVVAPGNYLALSYYLRKDAVMPFLLRIDRGKALKLTFCDEAVLYAVPADDSGDRVLLCLETGGRTMNIHIRGGNLWRNLLACCMTGTYHDDNLPLN